MVTRNKSETPPSPQGQAAPRRRHGGRQAWNEVSAAYTERWPRLNGEMIEQAVQRLPEPLPEGWIHVGGCGPGEELPLLAERYPTHPIVASDLAERMVHLASTKQEARGLLVMDLTASALQALAAQISFFTLHLSSQPLVAGLASFTSLLAGGSLAALYFPPTPLLRGPLHALHATSRRLAPRPDPDWEKQLKLALSEQGAAVAMHTLRGHWRFDDLEDAQRSLELLPHIGSLRRRAGEAFVKTFWQQWRRDPGLEADSGGLVGEVGAKLLLARRLR